MVKNLFKFMQDQIMYTFIKRTQLIFFYTRQKSRSRSEFRSELVNFHHLSHDQAKNFHFFLVLKMTHR